MRKPLATGPLLCLACLTAAIGLPSLAEERPEEPEDGWRIVREDRGVRVSQLRRAGARLPTMRGVTEIGAGLLEVLAVFRDVPRHTEWRSRLLEARPLRWQDPFTLLTYNRIRGTWLVADRDVVVKVVTRPIVPGEVIELELRADAGELEPERGVVRITDMQGSYLLVAVDPERTRVDYRMRLDLGGALPHFVQRFASQEMPVRTLSGLREQVERTRGEYADSIAELRERGL